MLPDLEIGDLLIVPSMGAYTKASATSFNGFQPPVDRRGRRPERAAQARAPRCRPSRARPGLAPPPASRRGTAAASGPATVSPSA